MKEIYFDNAATTQTDPRVLQEMMPWMTYCYGNASSAHSLGRQSRMAIEMARKKIAGILDCHPRNILFTSGGTEAANTAFFNAIDGHKVSRILTSPTEHKCVLSAAQAYSHSTHVTHHFTEVNKDGSIPVGSFKKRLSEISGSVMVAIMHANNETGAINDIEAIGELCRSNKSLFFCDTVPTIGHLPISLTKQKFDFCSASAHKFHGPKGVGFLYVRDGVSLQPLIYGGGQEQGLRGGTENTAAIVGMATALEIAVQQMEKDTVKISSMKSRLANAVIHAGGTLNAEPSSSLYTILSASFPRNERSESLLLQLDMAGVAVSSGSACSASQNGSHVMEAIGAGEHINVRFSFSRMNIIEEADAISGLLVELLNPKKIALA